ncbi:MAG: PKD domain-containing protein [Bacteroidota bacterium]
MLYRLLFHICFTSVLIPSIGQISSSFVVKQNACIQESIPLLNNSSGSEYYWDFCSGDLNQVPEASALVNLNSTDIPVGIDFFQDTDRWYALLASRGNSTVYRLSFVDGLDSAPSVSPISNSLLSGCEFLAVYNQQGTWVALALNTDNDGIVRLTFNNGVEADPEFELLGDFGGLLQRPRGILLIQTGSEHFAFVSAVDNDKLFRIDFGSSYLTDQSLLSIDEIASGFNNPLGISMIQDSDEWVGLLSSIGADELKRLEFGSDIKADPIVTDLLPVNDITQIELVNEGGVFYAFASSRSDFYRLDFGSSMQNAPTLTNLGDFGILSESFGFDLVESDSEWRGYAIDFSLKRLNAIKFPNVCSAEETTSSLANPGSVSFSTSGDKLISLQVSDGQKTDYSANVVSVSEDVSPALSVEVSSICLQSNSIFAALNEPFTSYSWDFNNDGVEDSNEQNPQVDFSMLGGEGTYLVRLDVNDGTCDNFTEQEITIFPEPPTPVVSLSTPTFCRDEIIVIANATDESQHPGVLSYQWDFDNDGITDSTDPNPSISFSEAGTKIISVFTEIPGCESATETLIVDILPGPTADFSATVACEGDAILFTNSSQNATSFLWDFTDGVTSISENPVHVFPESGNYLVKLMAVDDNGCEDLRTLEVLVVDKPDVSFDFDVLCTSGGNQFQDQSSVSNADIVSWSWMVDGEEASQEQNPVLDFNTAGPKEITLQVVGSNGCEASLTQQVEVQASPMPDITATINCVGENSLFSGINLATSSPVETWLWQIDGSTYTTETASHVFNSPGEYEIGLEVNGENFCLASVTTTVTVPRLPEVDFALQGNCSNQTIIASEQLNVFNDPVTSRQWSLDGTNVGNGTEVLIEGLASGNYELTYELETANGCLVEATRQITINAAPVSQFTFDKFYGIPQDPLTFTNTSEGVSTIEWLVDGSPTGSTSAEQVFSFEAPGDYQVSLVALNDLGCTDTTTQDVIIRIPEVDLSVRNFDLIEENGTGRVLLEIENNSNLPIDLTNVTLTLENQFSISEQVDDLLLSGASKLVRLSAGIPLNVTQPTYFCVELTSQYANSPDLTPLNNEACLTINPSTILEDPFPNPVVDQLRAKLISPVATDSELELISATGKSEIKEKVAIEVGLNNIFIDMADLNPGIYFLSINVGGTFLKRKILKR